MTSEDFDIYCAIMLDGALNHGYLICASDHVLEMAQAPPESPKLEAPLDLGSIVLTPSAEKSLSDDDIIFALRQLRWGNYGDLGANAIAFNAEIITSGIIEPIVGVYTRETGACVRVETYIGRYTEVLLPQDARWDPNKRAAAQMMKGENRWVNK
jgi:hypothetical protein